MREIDIERRRQAIEPAKVNGASSGNAASPNKIGIRDSASMKQAEVDSTTQHVAEIDAER